MDTPLSTLLPCGRNLAFGALIGGLVGGAAGAVDAFTLALKAAPRPAARDMSRLAFSAGLRGAAGTSVVFGGYHALKCGLGATRDSHRLGEAPAAAASAGAALLLAGLVRPRPNVMSVGLLLLMDNAPLIMPLFQQ